MVKNNTVASFAGVAIVVKDSKQPAEVTGNIAISDDPKANCVEITGASDKVSGNELKRTTAKP